MTTSKKTTSATFRKLWFLLCTRLVDAQDEHDRTSDEVLKDFWKKTVLSTLAEMRSFDDYRYTDTCERYGFLNK